MNKTLFLMILLSLFLFFFQPANGYYFSATLNQITYAIGDSLIITGYVNTTDVVNLTANIYQSGKLIDSSQIKTSGSSPNSFRLIKAINESYGPGDYYLLLTGGDNSINISFKVSMQPVYLRSHLIKNGDEIVSIDTPIILRQGEEDLIDGNFTNLLSLSLSATPTIHYGNHTIGGKLYHFVLVDEKKAGVFNRLYIDDDTNFSLFVDTEDNFLGPDIEYQSLKIGSKFSNTTFRYLVGFIEENTGNKILLWSIPEGKPPYQTTDTVNFITLARNSTHLLSNETVTIDIFNSSGEKITPTITSQTNNFGWLNGSINFNSLPSGLYKIVLNKSLGINVFTVQNFEILLKVTDELNRPLYYFSPNSIARINLNSKNSTGPINLDAVFMRIDYPDGSNVTKNISDFTMVSPGVYIYDIKLGNLNGHYTVTITGFYGQEAQTASTGFDISTVNFEMQAINTKYIEEAEGTEAMVDSFAPGSYVTIMTFLSNISSGMTKKGPGKFTELIIPNNCNSSLNVIDLRDENGNSYLGVLNPLVMNLSDAIDYLNLVDVDPPEQLLSQCMIIFQTPNKTGEFRLDAKMKYQDEEKLAGVKFGVQRLLARGATVDFKGDTSGFFAPNSTVRIKLKVTDMSTDEELSEENITSGKIIELYKVYPEFRDILGNSTERNSLNESIVNGTIVFTSPNEEGSYMMKFRFMADVDGKTETGIGNAFFMLKKYMIWGELEGESARNVPYIGQGQTINLSVNVIDIGLAQTIFGGYDQKKSCTGCGGFIINVSEIRNDQQFKKVEGYSFQPGVITNTSNPTATISIFPSDQMTTGWYSVDLVAIDPTTGDTYFGWASFEIRNFWVDIRKAIYNESDGMYLFTQEVNRGEVLPIRKSLYMVVLPRDPRQPDQILDPDEISFSNLISGWGDSPMTRSTLIEGEDYLVSVEKKQTKFCIIEQERQKCDSPEDRYVVNLTILSDEEGEYQANIMVINGSTKDFGSFWFSQSSYNIYKEYRSETWPPLFSPSENLVVNFTAIDFNGYPVDILNVTVEKLLSVKKGRPIKMVYGSNYTSNCIENFCQLNMSLANLDNGEYDLEVNILDEHNDYKTENIYFKVQDLVISIPYIGEAWVWESRSITKELENNIRKGEWSWCRNERNSLAGATTLCGDYCSQGGCQQFNITVPNVSYSKELYGYVSLVEDWLQGRFGSATYRDKMWVYTNGSHLWINSTPALISGKEFWVNLTETFPIKKTEMFEDSAGGLWRFDSIGEQSLTLTGITTLPDIGVLINTSYTKSGIIKVGQINEDSIGSKSKEGRSGVDLNGDGDTNDKVFFAISDSTNAGFYDLFFFSTNGDFRGNASPSNLNPISVNDPLRNKREFGLNQDKRNRLTLLSIDPRAERVMFYSYQIGDWNRLGEVKSGDYVKIPIMVVSPDGSERSSNISVTAYKDMNTWKFYQKNIVLDNNVTGLGEIKFNSSELGDLGTYSISVRGEDQLEEWKWPSITIRRFLVDADVGEALYISGFKQLPLTKIDGDSGKIIRIYSDQRNQSHTIDGVLAYANERPWDHCNYSSNSTPIIPEEIKILAVEGNVQTTYFLYNVSSGKLYMNQTEECHFDLLDPGSEFTIGSTLIINIDQRGYNVTILSIDKNPYTNETTELFVGNIVNETSISFPQNHNVYNVISVVNSTTGEILPSDQYEWNTTHFTLYRNSSYNDGDYNITYQYNTNYWRVDLGIPGINRTLMWPMSVNLLNNEWGNQWGYLQNVSLFGKYYDLLMTNSTDNYQRCLIENMGHGECAKKAWFIPRDIGDFSHSLAIGVSVGQNFTDDLYLVDIGPSLWDGITVGNFTEIKDIGEELPIIGGIHFADNTTFLFNVLNESELNVDLDKDGQKGKQFYILLFDSKYDYQQILTSLIIDDDIELYNYNTHQGTPIDISGNEIYLGQNANWTSERWGTLPSGIYSGYASFGRDYENISDWSQQPTWEIPFFNNTHLLLKKDEWRVNNYTPVDVLLKVYQFTQEPIQNANLSIVKIGRASYAGFSSFTNYTIDTTYNSTDQFGYGLLKIIPDSEWSPGNYQVIVSVAFGDSKEIIEKWFCVGQNCGG